MLDRRAGVFACEVSAWSTRRKCRGCAAGPGCRAGVCRRWGMVSLLYYPNRHRGALAAPVVGFPLGPGDGLDEGPGFVFELEEVDDFDGSGFLWSVR